MKQGWYGTHSEEGAMQISTPPCQRDGSLFFPDNPFRYFCQKYVTSDSPTLANALPHITWLKGAGWINRRGPFHNSFLSPLTGNVELQFFPLRGRGQISSRLLLRLLLHNECLSRPSSNCKHKTLGATTWRFSSTRRPRHTEWEKKRHTEM